MTSNCFSILVLTPIYPGENVKKSSTPVVHYFVREWVKQGYDVRVIHYPSNFPWIVNTIARPLRGIIGSKSGTEIRTWSLDEKEFEVDGVAVYRVPLKKYKPHGRYSERQIDKATNKSLNYCKKESFKPDVIVSHWVNPSLEIMHRLKNYFDVPTCFVAHDAGHDLLGIYKKETGEFIKETNLLGFRSESIRRSFIDRFHCREKKQFMCYSGIPSKYVVDIDRNIGDRNTLLFVGTLIERKYPVSLVTASSKVFSDEGFRVTYIGTGNEDKLIVKEATRRGVENNVRLLGRVLRDEVVRQMDTHSIFVMISRAETFGLVYLEAMARGCITIASRGEGFDGIIQDGVNGFLCKAGDVDELVKILYRIKEMPQAEIQAICTRAIETAHFLTDENVANNYLNHLQEIVSEYKTNKDD